MIKIGLGKLYTVGIFKQGKNSVCLALIMEIFVSHRDIIVRI